jgi:serine protease Do
VQGKEQLTRLVHETPTGRQVKIEVWRAGASLTLTPTIEAGNSMSYTTNGPWMPNVQIPSFSMPDIEIPRLQPMYQSPMLGIEGESLGQEEQLAEFFGVKDGVLVKAVTHDSAADKAGIKAGDVIVKVDGTHVGSTREITVALRAIHSKNSVTVTVVRNHKEMDLPVTLEAVAQGGVRAGAMLVYPDGRSLEIRVPVRVEVPLRIFRRDQVI